MTVCGYLFRFMNMTLEVMALQPETIQKEDRHVASDLQLFWQIISSHHCTMPFILVLPVSLAITSMAHETLEDFLKT